MSRAYWVETLTRIATPVLEAAADGRLRRDMPIRQRPGHDASKATHLEAIARLLCGIAPWLACPGLAGDEASLQTKLRGLTLRSLERISDPEGPDFLLDAATNQYLVDAAFLAQALLRARTTLWEPLDAATRRRILDGLARGRRIKPPWSNWLCFAAMCETAIWSFGGEPDQMRIDVCLRAHEEFYKGDGVYGDGQPFHWDYYNSFVIQPMLLEILETAQAAGMAPPQPWDKSPILKHEDALRRAQRYALVQERMIAPDGTYPPLGRSLVYRMAAFQTLGLMALRRQLPAELPPAQARCALTAMTRRLMQTPGTFDERGWLHIGLCGHQPQLGEVYISTGSVYLCAAGLLPLGLPPSDPFWSDPDLPWTSVRAYRGDDIPADHAW